MGIRHACDIHIYVLFVFGRRRNGGEEKGGRFERMNAFHSCLLGLPCIRKEKACSKTKGTKLGIYS